ncbi:MAG: protein-L-isoaspartate(D-aspartate) O-methyltransferase [Actinobacteria bacterium]|nr:protein-L-isoaspartate(D-aspartate) O-methyltransferase [Actinomycetota bacterium]
MIILIITVFGGCASTKQADYQKENNFEILRMKMVESQIEARGIKDRAVLEAMKKVPRHKFVTEDYIDQAYNDHPLPIGEGQTISQPYVVALMTELAMIGPESKVLEIGAGSGYQAAILAQIVKKVYSVEIIKSLGEQARKRLKDLGYKNIEIKIADGYFGWEENAPYDAIIVTAAPDHIPQPLINQLKDGGVLVIPVGPPGAYQTLWQIIKKGEQLISNNMGGVSFVPLTGAH